MAESRSWRGILSLSIAPLSSSSGLARGSTSGFSWVAGPSPAKTMGGGSVWGDNALRVSDLQIRKLFTERVAPRPGVADMLVEINDEQRRGWFLSYSVVLWRGRIGTVALPLVDFLQRSSHERCLVVLGQAFGVAERRDALLIDQHADRPRPVGAPHATIQPERIDDPQYRFPNIVVGK